MLKQSIFGSILAILVVSASNTFACGPEKNMTHMGNVTHINAADKTFTIVDMQNQSPVTFSASDEILSALKDANGHILVNYSGEGDDLKAEGVTF